MATWTQEECPAVPHPPRMCVSPAAAWIPHGRSQGKATRELALLFLHLGSHLLLQNEVHCLTVPHPNPRCHLPHVDEGPLIQHSVTRTVGKGPGPLRTTPILTSANKEKLWHEKERPDREAENIRRRRDILKNP